MTRQCDCCNAPVDGRNLQTRQLIVEDKRRYVHVCYRCGGIDHSFACQSGAGGGILFTGRG